MMKPRHEHKGTTTRYKAENKDSSGRQLEPELRKPFSNPQRWERALASHHPCSSASLLWVGGLGAQLGFVWRVVWQKFHRV